MHPEKCNYHGTLLPLLGRDSSRLPQNLSICLEPKGSGGNEEKWPTHVLDRQSGNFHFEKMEAGKMKWRVEETLRKARSYPTESVFGVGARAHHNRNHFHFGRLVFGGWETLSAGIDIITHNIFRFSQPERRFPTLGY